MKNVIITDEEKAKGTAVSELIAKIPSEQAMAYLRGVADTVKALTENVSKSA